MHGPAPAHPPHRPPAQGTVILLRVVFVAVAVLSLGLLAWAPLLRAAIVQRGKLGWWLFGADLVAIVVSCALITSFAETDWRTNVGVGLLLMQIAAAVAYYLVVDGRAVRAAQQGAGPAAAYPGVPPAAPMARPYGPPQPPAPLPPYAQETQPYGPHGVGPVNPYAMTETRLPAPPGPGVPAHPAPPPANPYPAPQDRPQPQRIDRVRAELDELSDYLRKEEGR